MLRALLYFFASWYMPKLFEASYHVPELLILHQVCTYRYDIVIGSQCTPSSLQHGYGLNSSAAQCGAVPCPSFCGAVSCGAVRSFDHAAAVTTSSCSCSTRYGTDITDGEARDRGGSDVYVGLSGL